MDNAAPEANEAPTNPVNDLIGIVLALTVVVILGLLLAIPWITDAPGGMLTRYAPARDGAAHMFAEYDATGSPVAWHSESTAILNKARALAGPLRPAMRDSVVRHFGAQGQASGGTNDYLNQFAGADFMDVHTSALQAKGDVRNTSSLYVRDDRGEWLVGLYDPQQPEPDTTFEPPVLNLPANLSARRTWQTEGTVSNGQQYRYEGRVVSSGAYSDTATATAPTRHFDDCVQVETTFTLTSTQVTSVQRTDSWYCIGLGLVEMRNFDAQDKLTSRYTLIASDQLRPELAQLPPMTDLPAAASPSAKGESESLDLAQWHYTRVGQLGQEVAAGSSTIPPTWIPSKPPVVLTAGYNGDLTAFDAADPTGSVLWTFHTEGTIYGPPGYDAARNRIYFGSSDKRLYALDARGLFVWTFQTGDSIASRPVVISDTVIFGSEDRNIYGVDAGTGALRWKVKTGGAVVSSPALTGPYNGLVVIGSDDGGVYALDALTGEQQWLFTAGEAIEAPLVVRQDMVYAASRDNSLYAIDSVTGNAVWSTDVGEVLRSAPAVSDANIYIVDDGNRLHALDRNTGKLRWSTVERSCVGTPIIAGGSLLVAERDGSVARFSLNGARTGEWLVSDATLPTDLAPRQVTSPVLGGDGALWLADDNAVVRRVGPKSATAALTAAWEKSTTEAPFQAYFFAPAAEYKGQALLVDGSRNLFTLNPATGEASLLGSVNAAGGAPAIEPTISGDTLLIPLANALYAVHLPDVKPLWQVKTGGLSVQPAVVAGDTALVLADATTDKSAPKRSTLFAVDLSRGAVRWQQTNTGMSTLGGVVADASKGVVYISTPPAAFDLKTGRRVWQASLQELATGGVALSPQGDTLIVGLYDSGKDTGSIAALNTADGRLRWQTPFAKDALAVLDRPWLSGNTVVAPLLSGKIVALDIATGQERWEYKNTQLRFGNISVIDGSHVWLALQNGELLALDLNTGKPAARYRNVALSLASYNFSQHPLRIGNRIIAVLGMRVVGLETGD